MAICTQWPDQEVNVPANSLDTASVTQPKNPDVKTVLVVDDSRSQRRILSMYLKRSGYDVIEADSGEQGLAICQEQPIDLVLSDWMMPGMNGLEFCKAFRALENDRYGYFILLTSKSEKGEVAHGLDVGADDFLTKPVAATELRARVKAGERVLNMQAELVEKNRLVNETLSEISMLYDSLDRDLIEARSLQQSLVRERSRDFDKARVTLMLRQSGHVGGDLVGFFEISDTQFGLFSIDVSGHGLASALMTARVAGYFSGVSPDQNLALMRGQDGNIFARLPSLAAAKLNDIILEEMQTELYFTMVLGVIDTECATGTFVQCGHPSLAVQRADGTVEYHGDGGLPIGLIPGGDWDDFIVDLAAGDRILMASDGITECPSPGGELLDEDGLADILRRNSRLKGNAFFETMIWDLTQYAGDKDFPDDVSGVLLEFNDQMINS